MATYKGIEIDDGLLPLVRHMQGVEDYREVLSRLQGAWDSLTLLGQLTGAASEMSGTRGGFEQLTGELLNHLGRETRRKAIAKLAAKVQVSIDILARNLFERTADIGFLATDDDIVDFLRQPDGIEAIEKRLREYVAKYSVYADVILFDDEGEIRARLIPHPCQRSQHPLLNQARDTQAGFVEYYGAGDFLAAGDHLVYAYRITSARQTLGTLALVFRLEDEMESIFTHLVNGRDPTVLACVDARGRVISSSSAIQLPPGTRLGKSILETDGSLVRIAGRDYIAVCRAAQSYQGYPGPGWYGLGLLPLEFAFEAESDIGLDLSRIDDKILGVVTANRTLFSDALRQIPIRAAKIQEDLNRSVWNGSVRQSANAHTNANASFAKTLLWEISSTGRKTQAVFEDSIGNLNQTVVATQLQNSMACAAFAIDVMDRNLYERANDCRWWALNASFCRILSTPASAESQAEATRILAHINSLYTVYHNLILFDAQGEIRAVSNPDAASLCGSRLGEEWAGRCLRQGSTQDYVVSRHEASPLYGGQHTYIYAAALREPGHPAVRGGMAVVFDGVPQFDAMLHDSLPRTPDGHAMAGSFSAFLQHDGTVIASTRPDLPPGSHFPLGNTARRAGSGNRSAEIREFSGQYYVLGSAHSEGYREFKNGDGYREDTHAIVAIPLGSVDSGQAARSRRAELDIRGAQRGADLAQRLEIATFFVGQQWLGLPAVDIVEAIAADGIAQVFGGGHELICGVRPYRDDLISVIDLGRLIDRNAPSTTAANRQVIVVRAQGKPVFGLLVDELGEIPEVDQQDIQSVSQLAGRNDTLTVGVISGLRRTTDRYSMLSLLSVERLCLRLGLPYTNALCLPAG